MTPSPASHQHPSRRRRHPSIPTDKLMPVRYYIGRHRASPYVFNSHPSPENIERSLETLRAGQALRRMYEDQATNPMAPIEPEHTNFDLMEMEVDLTRRSGSGSGAGTKGVRDGELERHEEKEKEEREKRDVFMSDPVEPDDIVEAEQREEQEHRPRPRLAETQMDRREPKEQREVVDLTGTDDDEPLPPAPAPPAYSTLSPGPRPPAEWSKKEMRALWLAQLKYGEGKEWPSVMRVLRRAGGPRRSIQECQAKWEEIRAASFGPSSMGY